MLALRVICNRRTQSGQECMRCIAGHFFTVFGATLRALAAGRLEASWFQVARDPLHPSGALKRVVLAQATASFPGATTKLVKLRLTSAGRTAFSHGSLVKLFVKGAFVMSDAAGVSWVAPSTLSH